MRSVVETQIRAPAALVFLLVRDVSRWPRVLPHYVQAEVLRLEPGGARTMAFVARRPLVPVLGIGLPVAWRARTWNEPKTLTLHFVHLGGATSGMDVTWRIQPVLGGTRVVIEHVFVRWGRAYPWLVDRLFTRPIASRTLASFKALAEALAETAADSAAWQSIHESTRPIRANPKA